MGVKFDLILVLRSQFFDFLRKTLYKRALEHLEAAGPEKKWATFFLPTVNVYRYLTSSKVCDWSGHIFDASASPRPLTKKMTMSPPSTVHSGQHDTKYVAFELLMHAAFVADEIWGFMPEPARIRKYQGGAVYFGPSKYRVQQAIFRVLLTLELCMLSRAAPHIALAALEVVTAEA